MTTNNYDEIKNLVKKELTIIENNMLVSLGCKEPLNSKIKEFLLSPSKRIRSVLAILYLKSQGYDVTNEQLELLSAIEIVHNASLIHDDIIDDSLLRRGQKTISGVFGNKLGVIAGDYLLAIAMEKIAKLNSVEILNKFSNTLRQMCLGEIEQNFELYKIGTIADYLDKSKKKTAYLFETAVVCCSILVGLNDNGGDFALNVGLAFQIRDDLINVLHCDNSKPSTDIQEGIYTAPVIYAQSVDNYLSGIEKTRDLLNNYLENAKKYINNFENNEYTVALNKLLESLKNE